MIQFECPCGKKLRTRDDLAGRTLKCTYCGAPVTVPGGKPPEDDGLRILEVEGDSAPGPEPPPTCIHHPGVRAVGTCMTCAVPICRECHRTFGYYCSEEHKGQVDPSRKPIATMGSREEEIAAQAQSDRVMRIIKRSAAGAGALLVLYLAWWLLFPHPGDLRWSAELPDEHITQVIVDHNRVHVLTGKGRLLVYDAEGNAAGSYQVDLKDEPVQPDLPKPTGQPQTESMKKALAMFAKNLGEFEFTLGFSRHPVVDGLLLVTERRTLTAISLADGRTAWTFPDVSGAGWRGEYAHDGGRVFVPARLEPEEAPKKEEEKDAKEPTLRGWGANHLVALRTDTGKAAWKIPLDASANNHVTAGRDHLCVSSTSYPDGFAVGKKPSRSFAIHAAGDGKLLWRIPEAAGVLDDPLFGPRGLVVITTTGPQCLSYADGTPVWKVPLDLKDVRKTTRSFGRTFETTESAVGKTWILGDTLLLHVGRGLISIDMASGKLAWNIDAGAWIEELVEIDSVLVASGATLQKMADKIRNEPFIAGSDLMADVISQEMGDPSTSIPYLAGYDAATGRRLWHRKDSGPLLSTPDGVVMTDRMEISDYPDDRGRSKVRTYMTLRMIDPSSGDVAWENDAEGELRNPVVAGDSLIFADNVRTPDRKSTGRIVALRLR